MIRKIFFLSILLLMLSLTSTSSQIQATTPTTDASLESAILNRSAFDYLISTLWNSKIGAFMTSPKTEPYNFWTDDQAKILNLLTLDYSGTYLNQTADEWGVAIRNYIASVTMIHTGYVLRRTLSPLVPFVSDDNIHDFLVGNNIFDIRGDLTRSTDLSNRIVYDPQGRTLAYIQGHVLNYNGTDHDLSAVQQPTSVQIITTGETVDLRQTWSYPDFILNIDYFLQPNRPYLLVKYTLVALKLLCGPPKIVIPLDQLDLIGPTVSPGGPHIGYGWFWAPGYQDQRAIDNMTPQHLLGGSDTPVSRWNQTWYMVHIHDKFDGTMSSFAIIADWGTNRTGLVAVDNQLYGSPIPNSRIPDTLHYLRQYYQLPTNMTVGSTASFELKYYFLAAHDWLNLAPVYQELMSRNLNNTDLSSTYEYGAIVYGLAKLYQVSNDPTDYSLAKRIENYWFSTFTATGPLPARNGTYAQSIGFMIRAELLLAKIGTKIDQASFANHATTITNELLEMQDITPTDRNFGMIREREYESLNGTERYGSSYIDFQALAIAALSEYMTYDGYNETIQSRINLLTNHLFLTTQTLAYGVVNYNPRTQTESIQRIGPGRIACWLNTSLNVIDADIATYKNGLLLDAFTHTYSIGFANSTFTLREVSYLWVNSALTPSAISYVEWTQHQETNTETTPWGVWGWREWVNSMLTATNQHVALIYLQPSAALNRLIEINWRSTSGNELSLQYTLNASRNFNSTLLIDTSPTAVNETSKYVSLSGLWTRNSINHTLTIATENVSQPTQVTINITWLNTTNVGNTTIQDAPILDRARK